jgi:hypothetical protein
LRFSTSFSLEDRKLLLSDRVERVARNEGEDRSEVHASAERAFTEFHPAAPRTYAKWSSFSRFGAGFAFSHSMGKSQMPRTSAPRDEGRPS